MLLKPDCIACIFKMAVSAADELGLDEVSSRKVLQHVLRQTSWNEKTWSLTSPELIEPFMVELIEAAGDPDPFREIKERQNALILKLYPFLKETIRKAGDPLAAAIRLAAHGNAIDVMMDGNIRQIENSFRERMAIRGNETQLADLMEKIDSSRTILYIGDNCGEAVCDRLLMETITERHDVTITFAVRHQPALNDVTFQDALGLGMDSVADVIHNGADGPIPGTVLERCSQEFNKLVDRVDLIISKGGGNFDTLSEQAERLRDRIYFILLAKCRPYTDFFQASPQAPIVAAI